MRFRRVGKDSTLESEDGKISLTSCCSDNRYAVLFHPWAGGGGLDLEFPICDFEGQTTLLRDFGAHSGHLAQPCGDQRAH